MPVLMTVILFLIDYFVFTYKCFSLLIVTLQFTIPRSNLLQPPLYQNTVESSTYCVVVTHPPPPTLPPPTIHGLLDGQWTC